MVQRKDDELGHFQNYSEYSKTLRSWLVAYGIGGPVLFLTSKDAPAKIAVSPYLGLIIALFVAGVAAQILLAFINKWAAWNMYKGTCHNDYKTSRAYRKWDWINDQSWIDYFLDLGALFAFSGATWLVLNVLLSPQVAPVAMKSPPSPILALQPPTAVEAFHLQTECVALGQKIEEDNVHGTALTQSQVAKYVPSKNRCFVELTIQHVDISTPTFLNISLYDGQTGEMLAFAKKENGKQGGRVFGDAGVLGYEQASTYIENTMSGK